jgi:hypothetical protein
MTYFPFIKRYYLTDLHTDEIKSRVKCKVAKPDRNFTFQKAAENRILEGKTTDTGFVVVMGRYAMTYGRTSLLPYLIVKIKPTEGTKTRLDIVIQPSLGSGLVILSIVYILAAIAIYVSWTKSNVQGVVISSLLIVVTYISMLLKFNKEKKTYLDFIEKDILRN